MDAGNPTNEWRQGNITIRVYGSAYAAKTPEELQIIRDGIDRACLACVRSINKEDASGKADSSPP